VRPATQRPRLTVALVLGGVAVALLLRAALLHGENRDTELFTLWLAYLQDNGAAELLRHDFVINYTPLYLYHLILANAVLPGDAELLIVKYLPIVFDVVCAYLAYKLVRLRHTAGRLPLVAFGVVLFAPTVVVNSSYWGQVDSVWTAGLLACVYFLITRREALAFVAFGLAFALKVQAVFLLPLLVVLALRREVRWRSFLLIPAVYLASIVPAAIAGRPFWDLATLYKQQAGYFAELTLNAANLYAWIPDRHSERLAPAATFFALALVLGAVLLAARLPVRLDADTIVATAAFSLLLVPFVLPHMHERYFYAADVLTIVLAFYRPRWAFVAVLVQVVSFLSYWPFLFGHDAVPLATLAVVETGALVALGVLLARQLRASLYP